METLWRNIYNTSHKNTRKYKFGVAIPRNYNNAINLDKENNNTLWKDAIDKEMSQIKEYKTFTDHGKGRIPPKGYKKIPVHLVFDVKYDLRRKARLVAGGHLTEPTHDNPYSGIASI